MKKIVSLSFAIVICVLSSVSCTIYKGIKYGNAAVDDYTIFEQDTVKRGSKAFTFAVLPQEDRKLDTMKLDFYYAPQDSIYRMTIPESMERIRKPAAALIVRNDTVIFEHYCGG